MSDPISKTTTTMSKFWYVIWRLGVAVFITAFVLTPVSPGIEPRSAALIWTNAGLLVCAMALVAQVH